MNQKVNMMSVCENDCEIECEKLYEDCICIGGNDPEIYAYAPKNDLDVDLFKLLISNELLQKPNIQICNEICDVEFYEQFLVGHICVYDNDTHPKCNLCDLTLPVDLEYFTLNDKNTNYNLCTLCCKGGLSVPPLPSNTIVETEYKTTIIESGIDNIRDWICIFTYKSFDEECGYPVCYIDQFYCNLNSQSTLYKQFAKNAYVDMLGDDFSIIAETCIEDVISKHCK